MKINEVITKEAVTLSPEKRKEEDELAQKNYQLLVTGPGTELANLFMRFYLERGTVDGAMEMARAQMARSAALKKDREKRDHDQPKKIPSTRYVSSYKGEKDPSMRKKSFQKKTQGDGAPGPSGPSGPGRGKYTQYKDGSDRAAAPKSKTQQAAQGIEKWASDSFGDLPGAGLVKGAYKLGKGAVNVATAPVRAVAKDLGKGYNFLRDPEAYSKFKQSKRK